MEVSKIGRSLIRIAELLKEEKDPAETPIKKEEPITEQKTLPACTFTDVKKAFFTLSEAGKDEAAITLLSKFGCSKLSDVKEEDYTALKAEAEAIANA